MSVYWYPPEHGFAIVILTLFTRIVNGAWLKSV